MPIAIKAENISKAYQLGEIGTGTLSRDLERWVARIRGKEDPFLKIGETNDRTKKGSSDIVWSLKDINFEIEQGDAVGIIGRNGAGKSTLLKVLSRVTSPTTGRITGKGRIASLLEVGTGFHPELTGRENIYLNGAILGMRKREIARKFDEIVDFAGVERYIDTPVKRYSSGMYVRLAFAVAAHLESEILIVDEVLAVGDAEFQQKCLGKMGEVSKGEGRTVLFVSHNMGAVQTLCNKGIMLNDGKVFMMASIRRVVEKYNELLSKDAAARFKKEINAEKSVQITRASLLINEKESVIYNNDNKFEIEINVFNKEFINVAIEIIIKDEKGTPVLFTSLGLLFGSLVEVNKDQESLRRLKLKLPFLASGLYYIDLILANPGVEFYEMNESALTFEVPEVKFKNTNWIFKQIYNQGSILIEEVEIKNI